MIELITVNYVGNSNLKNVSYSNITFYMHISKVTRIAENYLEISLTCREPNC